MEFYKFPKAPTVTIYSTAGASGTYTPPSGCLYLRVTLIGAGGGGAGGTATGGTPVAGSNGTGTSSFGTSSCTNGNGAPLSSVGGGGAFTLGAGHTLINSYFGKNGQWYDYRQWLTGTTNIYAKGGDGGSCGLFPATPGNIYVSGSGGWGAYGCGGAGGGAQSGTTSVTSGSGGGGGGAGIFYSPPTSQAYSVATGGSGGSGGTGGTTGGTGGGGLIIIEEYYS